MNWTSFISGDLELWASQVARDVSRRLSDPRIVEQAAEAALSQTAYPKSTHWLPFTVSQGYAGLAMLWGHLDACFPGEGWDSKGKQDIERAARDAEPRSPTSIGLFSGLSGLGLAAWCLSKNGTRYRRLLASIDESILPKALEMSASMKSQTDGVNISDFDAISGLSGVGTYLLCRGKEPHVASTLSAVIEALASLILEGDDLPRWHTPFRLLWDDQLRNTYPLGNLNCGLAHGLPGILAFLSLCSIEGHETANLKSAICNAAAWLRENRCDDEWGMNWPTAVSIVQVNTPAGPKTIGGDPMQAPDGTSRCAWCYGSPGIARSLWLAGQALDDEGLRQLAILAMHAVFRRPIQNRRIDSPTLCHGKAGLLQITLRFANDTGHPFFRTASENLVREVLLAYQPQSLLGYRNTETVDREIDQPGLLDGASGVALALLSAACSTVPQWDRLFLLA